MHVRRASALHLLVLTLLASVLLALPATPANAQTNGLVITGVIDGPLSGGTPKAVELFATGDIADLSTYGISSANNGGGATGAPEFVLSGSATAGDYLYVASESPLFTTYFGFGPDFTDSAANINGDDAIELFHDGAVIDVFGDVTTDGTGQPWDHVDGWAYRVDDTGPDGSTFVLDSWTFSGPDALDGCSTNATCGSVFPIGSYEAVVAPAGPAFSEPFDDATQYMPSVAEFTDGSADYFIRTDGSDIGSFVEFTGADGSFFAAQDTDGDGGPTTVQLDWSAIDISGLNSPEFSGRFAEDDSTDGDEDWDADASVQVQVQVDGAGYETVLAFEAAGGTNTEPAQDTNLDGLGDGTALTPEFSSFAASVPTGTTADLRIVIANLEAGDEDIAFDDFVIGEPGDLPNAAPSIDNPDSFFTAVGTPASLLVTADDADGALAFFEVVDSDTGVAPSYTGITFTEITDTQIVVDIADTAPLQTQTVLFRAADGEATTESPMTISVDPLTLISEVQGAGTATPLEGQPVSVQGIVTSLFERGDVLDAFFLQEEDADADGDDLTSEGIYVFCRGDCPAGIAVGDLMTVTGEATEFFGMTQVDAGFGSGSFTTVATAQPLPTAVEVDLDAVTERTDAEGTFEAVEGMVTTFPSTLTVDEYFELARFGQIVLSAGDRPYQFTYDSAPSVDGYAAFLDDLESDRIILDDDNNDQNDAIDGPDADEPFPFPTSSWPPDQAPEGLSTTNAFRGGDTIAGLTGVMHWSFPGSGDNTWRLRPIDGQDYSFDAASTRPAAPADVGGDLTVASFNVLNYFPTIDVSSSGSSGDCFNGADCRGADSAAELQRQTDKIVDALATIDADIVGLIEIENSPTSVQTLVDALNAQVGAGTYAQIDTGTIGTDAIKVGFIYTPATVSPQGEFAILDSSVDPDFIDTRNRPALVQTFVEDASGEVFTAAINHLKSKGSGCDGQTFSDGPAEDESIIDGQASCSETRDQAAQALADFLADHADGVGDDDVLILGDLNAYRQEDAIVTLEEAGYVDLAESLLTDAYGYLFDGQLGYLDYAMANGALASQVSGISEWHINADEVPLFDYNDDVLDSPGEQSFERESSARPLYEPNAFRSSDHDPVVVGLALGDAPVDQAPTADAGGPYTVAEDATVDLDGSASSDAEGDVTYAWTVSAGTLTGADTAAPTFDPPAVTADTDVTATLVVTDSANQTDTATATITVTDVAPAPDPGPGPDPEPTDPEPTDPEGPTIEVGGDQITNDFGDDRQIDLIQEILALLFPELDLVGDDPLATLDPSVLSVVLSQLLELQTGDDTSFAQSDGVGVLIASDEVFADSLASGTLQTGGTRLLLNSPTFLEREILAEIQRLGVTEVTILGGTEAIGRGVEDALTDEGLAVTRIAGASRIETAIAVADEAANTEAGFLARAFAATADDPTQAFADSLALGGWAATDGTGIYLSQTDVLTGNTSQALEISEIFELIAVGGVSALSDAVLDEVRERGIEVDRASGATRFETAVAIANARGFDEVNPAQRVIVVDGQVDQAWTAGFASAALSGALDAPIVLTNRDILPEETEAFLTSSFAPPAEGVSVICLASVAACDAVAATVGIDS